MGGGATKYFSYFGTNLKIGPRFWNSEWSFAVLRNGLWGIITLRRNQFSKKVFQLFLNCNGRNLLVLKRVHLHSHFFKHPVYKKLDPPRPKNKETKS